jgi:hypothetical protein
MGWPATYRKIETFAALRATYIMTSRKQIANASTRSLSKKLHEERLPGLSFYSLSADHEAQETTL